MNKLSQHDNFIQIKSYGTDGKAVKEDKSEMRNLTFILMELVDGGCLFDVCEKMKAMGEDGAR